MDINQVLLERKQAKKKLQKIHNFRTKKTFHTTKKYIDQEIEQKLSSDLLADKKKQFYDQLFSNEQAKQYSQKKRSDIKQQEPEQIQVRQKKVIEIAKPIVKGKTKKEKRAVKKIHTQRTSQGQPVMKNYLNYLVSKLEKERSN